MERRTHTGWKELKEQMKTESQVFSLDEMTKKKTTQHAICFSKQCTTYTDQHDALTSHTL